MFNILPLLGKRSGRIVLGTFLGLAVLAMMMSASSLADEKSSTEVQKVDTPPEVTRGNFSKPQKDSVKLHFQVQSKDSKDNLFVYVYYGEEDGGQEPDKWASKTPRLAPDKLKGKDKYTVILNGLEPGTTYFYRVQATDSGDVTWSEPNDFDTKEAGLPMYISISILFGVLAAFVVPFWIGGQIAKAVQMPDYGWRLGTIFCSLTLAIIVIITGWPPSLGIDLSGGVIMVYELKDDGDKKAEEQAAKPAEGADQKADDAKDKDKDAKAGEKKDKKSEKVDHKRMMEKMIAAIVMRVDPGGTREVMIRPYGDRAIQIIIPKASPEEVKRIQKKISEAGTLEFRILANRRDHADLIERAEMASDMDTIKDENGTLLAWWVPVAQNREDEFKIDRNIIATRTANVDGVTRLEVLVVNNFMDVTGEYLSRSSSGVDESGRPCVHFNFNSAGAKRFGILTGKNLPDGDFYRHLGIVLNGYLYSAPTIQSRITSNGMIHGSFSQEEVDDLVDVLNAGSLPAELNKIPVSKLEIGPTLGRDTVEKGKIAIVISVVIVLVFMALYYNFAGLIACGALLMNIILLFGLMIAVHADFTLPGIAGLVLTVGMAVDANVLIFERIREELDRGAALRMAIRNGFAKATTTIVDANVTTLITAIILFVVGTQQIRGFAVILFLGITLSMFTAIFCARAVFDICERRRIISKLSMRRVIGSTTIDFVRLQTIGVVFSLVLICGGLFAVFERGKGVLDIDFTGGESVTLRFKEPQSIKQIREDLDGVLPDLTVSDTKLQNEPDGLQFVINTSFELPKEDTRSPIDVVEQKLKEIYGDKLVTNELEGRDMVPLDAEGNPTADLGPTSSETDKSGTEAPENPSATSSSGSTSLAADDEEPKTETPDAEAPAETPDAETPAEAKSEDEAPEQPKAEDTPPVKEPAKPAPMTANRFANGTMVKLVLAQSLDHESVKEHIDKVLETSGLTGTAFELGNDDYYPNDTSGYNIWMLRIALPQEETATKVVEPLAKELANEPFFPSASSIGGRVAGDYQSAGILAIVASLICIVGYIWIRFQRVVFGLAAVVALVHDVLITLGAIALSAYVANMFGFLMIDEFKISLSVLAALLTIIGYSLNDTIVVFDRIREVRGKSPNISGEMINTSINQTLSRTLLTSLTTLVVVVVLYILGGQGLHAFSFTLIVGVVVGTYSSIFIASPILLWMSRGLSSSKKR